MAKDYKVFMNGDFVPENEASVSVFDHGFLYGDGVFEGIRAYEGQIFKLDDHLDRLYASAKAIDLTPAYDKGQLADLILEACRINDLQDAYIRPIFSRGVGDLGLDPRKCSDPSTIIIARAFPRLYSEELYEQGLTVGTVSQRRNPPQCLSPNIKSMNYLNNILGRIEANQRGVDEGLMLDINGFVSEATADNVFIIEGETIVTPPYHNSLQGITRQAALDVAELEGFETTEKALTLFDVYSADEMFITGTAAEIAPIVEVDGRAIGTGKPGAITKQLVDRFTRYVRDPKNGTAIYTDKKVEA